MVSPKGRRTNRSGVVTRRRRRWLWFAALGSVTVVTGMLTRKAAHGPVRAAGAVRLLYDRLAPAYDPTAWAFQPLGARRLRDQAMTLLQVQPGDTVVDLGCGTGVNLPVLSAAVGPMGHVVGVDLSPGMLRQARGRADALDLNQVTLVQADMRDFQLPAGATAVLASFSLEMVPEYDEVLSEVAEQLAPVNGHVALLGLRRPDGWPNGAIAVARAATALFGVTSAYEEIRPWLSVKRHFEQVHVETAAAGAMYLAVGRARPPG